MTDFTNTPKGDPVTYKMSATHSRDIGFTAHSSIMRHTDQKSVNLRVAYPDGTLVDRATGNEYSYLFWEGISHTEYDFSRGYVIAGEDTAEFLEATLAELGLNRTEANEFIVYWLPRMQGNPYNLISFQRERYTDAAKLTITPEPDSVLRVFMAYQALDEKIEVEEPVIEPFERNGFTVVEWGGAEIK